tara:strand:+ start:837 stop:1262 length:426 start_codon:yes stop_codon:yes gene_type:complete
MKRVNLVYSVTEEEYNQEIKRLLESSAVYLGDFTHFINQSISLHKSGNQEGCLNSIGKARDCLADADYRLHDIMNLIVASVDITEEQPAVPQVVEYEAPEEKLSRIDDRLAQVRKNVKSLGIQVSDAELEKLLESNNDKTD